mgnify:CR=1 FL=1
MCGLCEMQCHFMAGMRMPSYVALPGSREEIASLIRVDLARDMGIHLLLDGSLHLPLRINGLNQAGST